MAEESASGSNGSRTAVRFPAGLGRREEPPRLIEPAQFVRREAAIRAVTPGDYDWIAELLLEPTNLMTYRFGGIPPSPEQFSQLLWGGVAGQFLITSAGNPMARHGMVTFYNRNDHAQHCGLAVVMSPHARAVTWAWDGIGAAIDHWFRVTQTRKLWVEIPGWNMDRFAGLALLGFVEEGILVDHDWLDGRFWDQHLWAVFRDRWDELAPIRMQGLA